MISRPSLAELYARWIADVQSRIAGASAQIRRSMLAVLGAALTAAHHSLYALAQEIGKQSVPFTATGTSLEGWGSLWGVSRRLAAVASGTVTATGTPDAVIPEGTALVSSANQEYRVTAEAVLDGGGNASVSIEAVESGAPGNVTAGETLSFIAAPEGVNINTTVEAGGIGGGADIEADSTLRARLLQRIQNPPHGGNDGDYVFWATSVSGVDQAWTFPLYSGVGTVRVYIAEEAYDSGNPNHASAGLVALVDEYVQTQRPVTATVEVVAPVRQPVDISISAGPDSPELRAAIEASLAAVFEREAAPEGVIRLSHLREAVSQTPGEEDHEITVPAASPTADPGSILVLGTVTWV